MAHEPAKQAISISPAGIRGVWLRHDLEPMKVNNVTDTLQRALQMSSSG